MFKSLLVVLVVWCEIQRYVFTPYTSDRLFTIPNPENGNWSTITGTNSRFTNYFDRVLPYMLETLNLQRQRG